MTPDKRLDQIEPALADVAQKTDRLIESNGQILEVATRADINAAIAAKGVADLTTKVTQLAEGQADLRNITTDLRIKTDSLTEGQASLHRKTDLIADDQIKLRQEMQQGFQEVNQKFAQMEKAQQQILTILLDRLS